MKPHEPHSFTPRGKRAPGRYECAVCTQGADAPVHTMEMLRRMVRSEMAPVVCSTDGCFRKCRSRGKCRVCAKKSAVVSTQLPAEVAAELDAAAMDARITRGAFIRGVLLRALTVEMPSEDSTTKDPEHVP